MRKASFIAAFLLLCGISYAQIKTTHAAERVIAPITTTVPFDSTRNFIGEKNIASYIGQELLVNGDNYGRERGVENFYYEKEGEIVVDAKNDFATRTPYSYFDGKTYIVKEIVPDSRQGNYSQLYDNIWWFSLENKADPSDHVWFRYDAKYEHTFPFVTMSYYYHLVNFAIGRKIVSAYRIDSNGRFITRAAETDFVTGVDIEQTPEDIWTVKDVAIEDNSFQLVFIVENQNGAQSTIPTYTTYQESLMRTWWLTEYEELVAEYGKDLMETVRALKIQVGMPEKLLVMSWGEPDRINKDSTGSAQWVYGKRYVYVKDGIITAWN